MYIQVPVTEWRYHLREADFPTLRLVMCGYFGTTLTLLYPVDVVDSLLNFLLENFSEYVTFDFKIN